MSRPTRRAVLAMAGLGAAAAIAPGALAAPPRVLALPPGLQLWTVKEALAQDFGGTLRRLKSLGYARVEAAGWSGHAPAEFGKGMRAAGLDCFSCHFPMQDLIDGQESRLAGAKEVGARYLVASSPALSRPLDQGRPWVLAVAEAMTVDDWRRNADAMNRIGAAAKAMGLRFGYHNHPAEFLTVDGTFVFGELLRLTDPDLVTFELDLGWVAGAGYDPAAVLAEHGARIELLHVKDMAGRARAPGTIVRDLATTPVGAGTIDWAAVFRAAERARIAGWFVEQEPPFTMSPFTGLERSLAFLKALRP
jgi:sugar phosphate isomerase/epimerase